MNRLGLLGRNRAYRAFWMARAVSLLGDTAANVALVLHVYERNGDGRAIGLLLLAQTVPRVLAPFGGTIADRTDQRRLMLGLELGQAALIGVVALLLPPFPILLGLVAAAATLATLFAPAGRGAVPALVASDDLLGANALLGAGFNLSLALGPAIGGTLAAGIGARGALALDGLSFLVAAALLGRLPPLPPAGRAEGVVEGFFSATRAGWSYLIGRPVARAVALSLVLVVAFAAVDNVALVFLTRGELGASAAGYGIVAAAYGGAMVAAPLALARWGGRIDPSSLLRVAIALTGAGTLLTAFAPSLALAAAVQGIAGAGNGLENAANDTLIQGSVPRAMLGRVFGIVYGGAFVASSLAYAAGGVLLEATSPRAVFAIGGGGVLVALAVVWRMLPRQSVSHGSDGFGVCSSGGSAGVGADEARRTTVPGIEEGQQTGREASSGSDR